MNYQSRTSRGHVSYADTVSIFRTWAGLIKKPLTAEQQARDLLERMGIENAQSFSAGDLVELANLIAASHQRQSARCPLLSEDEYPANPYVASCGTRFSTYEEMARHERKHGAKRRSGT